MVFANFSCTLNIRIHFHKC